MKVLYFDCFSGASGDMVLGALIDAGVPLAEIRRALGSLAIDADAVWTEPVVRAGTIMGIDVLDHVILADQLYFSFAESGQLPAGLAERAG